MLIKINEPTYKILFFCLIVCLAVPSITTVQYKSEKKLAEYSLNMIENKKAMNKLTTTTETIIKQFNDAFQNHDPSLLTNIIAESCVMESIQGPDGILYEGYEACLKFWSDLATDKNTQFDLEDVFTMGNRSIIRWRYFWGKGKGQSVRGVTLVEVLDGKITEALGYSKTSSPTGLDN